MRSFLINKNVCFYYSLRKKIGRSRALVVATIFEKIILIFGRERIPFPDLCVIEGVAKGNEIETKSMSNPN
jgi:hypothetical protein